MFYLVVDHTTGYVKIVLCNIDVSLSMFFQILINRSYEISVRYFTHVVLKNVIAVRYFVSE